MINRVKIKGFKRFDTVEFQIPGHVVLAGPNNTGKTTLLQAVASWSLALNRWKELNDYNRRRGGYARAPIARQAFSTVPLRSFNLLWNNRKYKGNVEIEVRSSQGWTVAMEFISDTTEQIHVRPGKGAVPDVLKEINLSSVFVPPMSGLGYSEPVLQRPKVEQLLGLSRPGEVIRNLLVDANNDEKAWPTLRESISRLFDYEILPPDSSGADIIAEYRHSKREKPLDIASAGSGFQQVLMLLAFLNTRPGSVLLIDEPDAHLHVILQDAIYGELRSVAVKMNSQLIVATHSEVIINAVDPSQLCVISNKPKILADTTEKRQLISSLGSLSNKDIMLTENAKGVLYVEGYTDLEILRAWAKVLNHPSYSLLISGLFWKTAVIEAREWGSGIQAKKHYDALKLFRDDLPGLILVDRDARESVRPTPITGQGFQRLRWKRYEIENYLVHPDAIARFVESDVGHEIAGPYLEDLKKHFEENYPPAFLKKPFGNYPYINNSKARKDMIPPALEAAGLFGVDYTRFHEIAALMKPEEIHPEVTEKLDSVCKAFNQ